MFRPRRTLIARQIPNEITRPHQSFRSSALPFPFLNAIPAKVSNRRFIRFDDRARRMRLRHSNQGDLFRPPPRARRSTRYLLLNSQQIFSHRSLRHVRIRILARTALQRRVSAVRLAFGRNSIRGRIQKMTAPGKLIAVEGIDGSGKRTQVELLTLTLQPRAHSVYSTGFPQYDSWFRKMVCQFLNGDLGPLESVEPHFTAMLYAADRLDAKPKLESALNTGQIVLVYR